jgi:hypothetical protein
MRPEVNPGDLGGGYPDIEPKEVVLPVDRE